VVLLKIQVHWDVPSLGRSLAMFLRVIMPSSSWSSSPVLGVPDVDDDVLCCCTSTLSRFEGSVVQDVAICLSDDTPLHPRSSESSAALL
jgi:hypothetical protein